MYFVLAFISFLATQALAMQMDSPYFDALAGRDLRSAGPMTWTGPLFSYRENHTLIGSIEVIIPESQYFSLNKTLILVI
jgi:hypothetical protein